MIKIIFNGFNIHSFHLFRIKNFFDFKDPLVFCMCLQYKSNKK